MRTKLMRANALLIMIFLVVPISAHAEVSDKIILPNIMLIYVAVLGTLGWLLNKKWPLWFPLTLLVTCALASGGLSTIFDEHVGAAAIREQGQSYVYFAYFEFIAVLLANFVGCYFGFKNRSSKTA